MPRLSSLFITPTQLVFFCISMLQQTLDLFKTCTEEELADRLNMVEQDNTALHNEEQDESVESSCWGISINLKVNIIKYFGRSDSSTQVQRISQYHVETLADALAEFRKTIKRPTPIAPAPLFNPSRPT